MRAVLVMALVLLAPGAARAQEPARVPVIELRGTIVPASAGWIDEALEQAAAAGAGLGAVAVFGLAKALIDQEKS